jgi:prolyl oligopeptidase
MAPAPAAPPQPTAADGPPLTAQRPVTDTYHGVSVVDPYRWLEQDGADEVKRWSEQQNQYTRSVLDTLPDLPAIRARVGQVFSAKAPRYRYVDSVAGNWFVLVATPPQQQPVLAVMPEGGELSALRTIVDPNQLDADGGTSIDWFVPSPDGKRVAVSMSKHGTEWGDVRVLDVASSQWLSDAITRVNGGTAGGDLAWAPDGKGFYYTRYPRAGERSQEDEAFYQQLYFHALGTDPASDRYELGKDLPRVAEIALELDRSSGRVLATVQKGDGGQFAHYLRDARGSWKQLSDYPDQIVHVAFASKDRLLAVSRRDAPRGKLLLSSAKNPDLARASTLIGESEHSIVTKFHNTRTFASTAQRLYVTYQLGGPTELRAFDWSGKQQALEAPVKVASVGLLQAQGARLLFKSQSYNEPAAWYMLDEASAKSTRTQLAEQPPVSLDGYKVVSETAVSKDGTRVPFSVMLPAAAALDGSHPCVVTGYGGYGVSQEPRFSSGDVLWLEQGVLFVVANLRGGGEFGDECHRQGALTHKQNVFDDFAAVLRALVERGYTRAQKLGIIGGSNGGLLMGATLTQHPELVRAVVSYVGIYDSLRSELQPNGAFNVEEFGTVKDPEQFKALYAYSPYHHVVSQRKYPPTFLLTGENDPRVGPLQTRKMAAQLQAAAAGSGTPILYLSQSASGHGSDMPLERRIQEHADVVAFMLGELGVKYH